MEPTEAPYRLILGSKVKGTRRRRPGYTRGFSGRGIGEGGGVGSRRSQPARPGPVAMAATTSASTAEIGRMSKAATGARRGWQEPRCWS